MSEEEAKKSGSRKLTLLRLEPQMKPVYFIVESYPGQDDADSLSYLYEECQCPHDTLRKCKVVISEGDTDPHGILEYVRTVDRPDTYDQAHDPQVLWRYIFPEAFDDEERPGI